MARSADALRVCGEDGHKEPNCPARKGAFGDKTVKKGSNGTLRRSATPTKETRFQTGKRVALKLGSTKEEGMDTMSAILNGKVEVAFNSFDGD